jgi:hypothetical protein
MPSFSAPGESPVSDLFPTPGTGRSHPPFMFPVSGSPCPDSCCCPGPCTRCQTCWPTFTPPSDVTMTVSGVPSTLDVCNVLSGSYQISVTGLNGTFILSLGGGSCGSAPCCYSYSGGGTWSTTPLYSPTCCNGCNPNPLNYTLAMQFSLGCVAGVYQAKASYSATILGSCSDANGCWPLWTATCPGTKGATFNVATTVANGPPNCDCSMGTPFTVTLGVSW